MLYFYGSVKDIAPSALSILQFQTITYITFLRNAPFLSIVDRILQVFDKQISSEILSIKANSSKEKKGYSRI